MHGDDLRAQLPEELREMRRVELRRIVEVQRRVLEERRFDDVGSLLREPPGQHGPKRVADDDGRAPDALADHRRDIVRVVLRRVRPRCMTGAAVAAQVHADDASALGDVVGQPVKVAPGTREPVDEHDRSPALRPRDVDVNRHAVTHNRHSAERSPSQHESDPARR